MFFTIFKHELKYWFRQPAFYIYCAVFFLFGLFFASSAAGIFDFLTVSTGSASIVNSPIGVSNLLNGLTVFIFFLFPSIIGVSIYRDFKSDMHSLLYSYPFSKADYLFAKFLSSVLIVSIIVMLVGVAMVLGYRLPGTNGELVGPFRIESYLQAYFVYIIPNILMLGSIVFGVVTFSRNVAAGFITVVVFLLLQAVMGSLLSDPDMRYTSALLEPTGAEAANYYTKYWTVAEQNEQMLPVEGVILYNRLIWLGLAALVFGLVFRFFSFSQNALVLRWRKSKGERATKQNFGSIKRINLPKVNVDYSIGQNLKTMWRLSNVDFKYIVKSWPFISILLVGLMFILIIAVSIGELFGTKTYPVTWQVLAVTGGTFSLFINLLTFLYAGMLVHRSSIAGANHLIDVTPIPNWTLLGSKFIALVKMQVLLLAVVLLGGIMTQIYHGYYIFEIGHYLFELYGLLLISFVIWALLAMFVQTLLRNPYVGLFVLLLVSIGINYLGQLGIEQDIYKYNEGAGYSYSDMNGYGSSIRMYMVYKLYWLLLGAVLLILSGLFWVRGLPSSFGERLRLFKERFNLKAGLAIGILLTGFLGIGSAIYYENNVLNEYLSANERELQTVEWEKRYRKFENAPQPRIVSVVADVNIYPEELNFDAHATFSMINKTDVAIDSLFLNYNGYDNTFTFDKNLELVSHDTLYNFNIYEFNPPLQPGEELTLTVDVKNKPNRFLKKNSPVLENGTFINSGQIFPTLGYPGGELTDDEVREKYGLPPNPLRPPPTDTTALGDTYISKDSDWIDFEATVSTSEDQIAIAPGYLQKEWVEDGRRYFHYKMDSPILNFYAFNSARYEIERDEWNDVSLEIYYHKGHEYNLERMMSGMKKSLEYNSDNFSPYQHKQARIIEFPRTAGTFAQSFPNTIPFSEGIGFIADVDTTKEGGVDYPFAVTAHEVAHQWWAHQVIGADVLGATMLSESLSEYVSLKVLEHTHGKSKMRKFLKDALDKYLRSRTGERKRENALMYNDGQGYIRYQKGSLVFYALSDYLGEDTLNAALKRYVDKVKFQNPPYTTTIEMVDEIKAVTPDSLQYLIADMFETVTLYQNRIVEVESTELDNGQYEVTFTYEVSKYRNNDQGKRYFSDNGLDSLNFQTDDMRKPLSSLPLDDYIYVGVFAKANDEDTDNEKELYLEKVHITDIRNTMTMIVDEEPMEVGVDPYNMLIDTDSNNNRREL